MTVDLIKEFISEPSETDEILEINEETKLFHIKEYKGTLSKEKILFLKNLYNLSIPDFRINKTSAVYFFKAGETYIELDIMLDNKEIHIKPYIHYNNLDIKKDLYKINELDYLLYSILKTNNLQ